MADSLVLTGSRQVTKHTGDEMKRHDAPRGGNTWKIPRWWVKGNGVVYTNCTVFKVTTGAGVCHLAVESSPSVNLRIDHDGSFGFTFSQFNEVSRAALFTDAWELIEHYVFPSISGGKVMTVVPAGAADKPVAGPPPTPTGPATGVTLVGSTSTEGDGSYTNVATTSNNGAGLTVSYDVAGGTASNLTIGDSAGNDYEDGDSFTVDGDTGVTGTVSI